MRMLMFDSDSLTYSLSARIEPNITWEPIIVGKGGYWKIWGAKMEPIEPNT